MYNCTEELDWLSLYDTVRHSWGWMPFSYVEGLILGALSDKPRKAECETRQLTSQSIASSGHCLQNTPSSRLLGWLSIISDLILLMKLHTLDMRE